MFKEAFKYYKSKQPPPDFSNVINFSSEHENAQVLQVHNFEINLSSDVRGLIPVKQWKIYRFKDKEGLIFIKNPFTFAGQRYWISRCLSEYTKKPNRLNIDAHNYLSENEDWWSFCNNNEIRKESLLYKLRWATLGYHHDWNTKVYSEASKDLFPADLALLCQYIASIIGYSDFRAEAAIINFYHMDSTLSGHTDHSEDNLEAPLFSFSFGQSAIFLIGGLTEDHPAVPIFIHSGDIVVMSKESRLCYHAVPKITIAPTLPWNSVEKRTNITTESRIGNVDEECKNGTFWKPFENYIHKSRININVRQVLRKGQNKLEGSQEI